MYAFFNKYGQMMAFGVGVLITLIFLFSILGTPAVEMDMLDPDSGAGPEKYETSAFDFGLAISLVLTVLAFIAAIVFGVIQLAANPKGSLKGVIGFVALLAVVGISYAVANDDIAQEAAPIAASIDKFNLDQGEDFDGGTLKFVSGSIIASVTLIAIAIISLVVFGIRGIFK